MLGGLTPFSANLTPQYGPTPPVLGSSSDSGRVTSCYSARSSSSSSTCSLPARRLPHHPQHVTPRAALARRRPRLSLSFSPRKTLSPRDPCRPPCPGVA